MKVAIVGSGFASLTFVEKLHAFNADTEITLITKESEGFYSRPLLSHGFSKPDIEQSIILKPFSALSEKGINLIYGTAVTAIDRDNKTIHANNQNHDLSVVYDKLILALGSSAFIPPPLRPYQEHFHLFNSLTDLKNLRSLRENILARKTPSWAIVGGGLIGCEIASDLAKSGDEVTIYHAVDRLMERQLVAEDSDKLYKILSDQSVKVLFNQSIQSIQPKNQAIEVVSEEAESYDNVIVSCGFKPRTELAATADLQSNRGILVNNYLQTNDPDIYALGDVAELPNGKLYAFILPIRSQANWLAAYLTDPTANNKPWSAPEFKPRAKVHGFKADQPLPF